MSLGTCSKFVVKITDRLHRHPNRSELYKRKHRFSVSTDRRIPTSHSLFFSPKQSQPLPPRTSTSARSPPKRRIHHSALHATSALVPADPPPKLSVPGSLAARLARLRQIARPLRSQKRKSCGIQTGLIWGLWCVRFRSPKDRLLNACFRSMLKQGIVGSGTVVVWGIFVLWWLSRGV